MPASAFTHLHTWLPSLSPGLVFDARPPFNGYWMRANGFDFSEACDSDCEECKNEKALAWCEYQARYNLPSDFIDEVWQMLTNMWRNIAIAHTASVFCLEILWNGDKFENEQQILSFVEYTGDSQEGSNN